MPPSKLKFHKKTGKQKTLPTSAASSTDSGSTTNTNVTSESANNLEVELCWCIQKLEISLQDKKLNAKQVQDSVQLLKVLKNKSQPVVRKRQLMRMHFGDYRSIMAKEEKRAKNLEQITFTKPSEKHVFLRKSAFLMTEDNNFKFNFEIPSHNENKPEENPPNNVIEENTNKTTLPTADTKLSFGHGEFRFNFDLNEHMEI